MSTPRPMVSLLLSELDEWRASQPGIPTRPEAIRRLVEMGLKAAAKGDS
jgi:metal-responsive CopG/Arc/MetJ family transcriptional regulator